MSRVLDFANKYSTGYKYDSETLVSSNFHGSKIYRVNSSQKNNLCLGFPVFIKDTNSVLSRVTDFSEVRRLMRIDSKTVSNGLRKEELKQAKSLISRCFS